MEDHCQGYFGITWTRRGWYQARAFAACLVSGLSLLAGCVHWPDIATECDAYGVLESHEPMGRLVIAEPLFREELDAKCAAVMDATARINRDAQVSGCVVPAGNGVVHAYYWTGDTCALKHELCHAAHGPAHTDRYLSELEAGVPRPFCPRSQLWPRS